MRILDLKGMRFGRLVADSYVGGLRKSWSCQCDCGNSAMVPGVNLRLGKAKSCGCLKAEKMKDGLNKKHGMYRSATHKSWESMIGRCTNENDPSFKRYGGSGISVCKAWMDFQTFLQDMGDRPAGKTLDRWPNTLGNYEPGNCRWATPTEQSNNRKNNRLVMFRGAMRTIREISDITGVNYQRLRNRILKMGWEPEMAVEKPVQSKKRAA